MNRMKLLTNDCTGQALIVFSHKHVLVHTKDKNRKKGRGQESFFKELLEVFAIASMLFQYTLFTVQSMRT